MAFLARIYKIAMPSVLVGDLPLPEAANKGIRAALERFPIAMLLLAAALAAPAYLPGYGAESRPVGLFMALTALWCAVAVLLREGGFLDSEQKLTASASGIA